MPGAAVLGSTSNGIVAEALTLEPSADLFERPAAEEIGHPERLVDDMVDEARTSHSLHGVGFAHWPGEIRCMWRFTSSSEAM